METETLTAEQERQKSLEELEKLRPLDDDLMRELFRNCKELVQLVLRIITDKTDLVVKEVHTQYDMHRLAGARSLCLDVIAEDSEGKIFNLEIQRSDDGAHAVRVRYHSSSLDVEYLKAGAKFSDLPITFVIFITENDVWKQGKPVYHFKWYDTENNIVLDDGAHILYVNGAYNKEGDNSDIAKLTHDFRCSNAEDMQIGLLAERTKYFKQTPEGVTYMCKIIEDRVNETAKRAEHNKAVDTAIKMIIKGLIPLEDIAEYNNLSLDEVKSLAEKHKPATA